MAEQQHQGRRIRWVQVVTWLSVGILVGTEIFGAAFAGAWAIAGLMELPAALTYALYGLFFVLAAYGMFAFMKYAARVESLTE